MTSKFKPGRSGNPKGRPKGISDRRTKWRDSLRLELPGLLERLVILAKDGDLQAIKLILDRTAPPLRPSREPVAIKGIAADAAPTAIAQALVASATRGDLASDAAAELVAALVGVARLREVDELATRIEALERAREP